MRDGSGLAVAQTVDRGGLSRRQSNLTLALQLQQQTPAGHVLKPPSRVAPVPALTQVAAQPRAIGLWMRLQPASNQGHILGADPQPLNDLPPVHDPRDIRKGKLSPEKRGASQQKVPLIKTHYLPP